MYDVIVIGAGPGGYEAAAHAAKMGKKTALIEKKYIGGTCLNVGCIPTKSLLHAANVYDEIKTSDVAGTLSVGPIDLPAVMAKKEKTVTMLKKGVSTMLKKAGVDVIEGTGVLAGKNKVTVGSDTYEAANILLATGSVPAKPPVKGMDSDIVVTSEDILRVSKVPGKLVVIGAGAIGLEFASIFNDFGAEVTVIEMQSTIAPLMDSEISAQLHKLMKRRGISFMLEAKVSEIGKNEVTVVDAEGKTVTVPADMVLSATGRAPVLEGIGLDAVGVYHDKKGVKTDNKGRTNVTGIWACGDVTGRSLLAHSATREGIVAINNMFGVPDTMRYTAIPSVIYTRPEMASVGMTEEMLQENYIEYTKSVIPMAMSGRYIIEYGTSQGYVKVLAGKKYGEILGVHMVGGECGELIFGAVQMMETQMRVDDIKEIVFPHPTVSEVLREAIIHMS